MKKKIVCLLVGIFLIGSCQPNKKIQGETGTISLVQYIQYLKDINLIMEEENNRLIQELALDDEGVTQTEQSIQDIVDLLSLESMEPISAADVKEMSKEQENLWKKFKELKQIMEKAK